MTFTVHSYEPPSFEEFDIGTTDDSLEAAFLARDEVIENGDCLAAAVKRDGNIIYVIDGVNGTGDYIARRDGNPVTEIREALGMLRA